jgi:superfamily II DNA/RNA helicase
MLDPWDPQVQILTQAIRETPLEQLQTIVKQLIPLVLMPSAEFLNALSPNERAIALRACLIVFILSESTMVPRQLQLQASLAELAGFDSTIISGTGSGKTLAIAIPHIIQPQRVSFVISPLKRLQITQVCLFVIVIHSDDMSRDAPVQF